MNCFGKSKESGINKTLHEQLHSSALQDTYQNSFLHFWNMLLPSKFKIAGSFLHEGKCKPKNLKPQPCSVFNSYLTTQNTSING